MICHSYCYDRDGHSDGCIADDYREWTKEEERAWLERRRALDDEDRREVLGFYDNVIIVGDDYDMEKARSK